MNGGQISLDLLLALIIALVFFALFNSFTDNLENQINESNVNRGLKTILLDAYATIGSVRTYEVQLEYTSPRLIIGRAILPCQMEVDQSNDSITVTSGTNQVSFEGVSLENLQVNGNANATFECGTTVTMRYV